MRVSFCVLCEFAGQMNNGSPVLVGVFRGLSVPSFPASVSPFYIAFEVEADPLEAGRDAVFEVRMIDEDGAAYFSRDVEFSIVRRPDMSPSYAYFAGLVHVERPLERAGTYRFDLVYEGDVLGQARLDVHLG